MKAETMSGKDVMRIANERGFTIVLHPGPPPMPVLRDPGGQIPPPTEPLLEALRAFRREILEILDD